MRTKLPTRLDYPKGSPDYSIHYDIVDIILGGVTKVATWWCQPKRTTELQAMKSDIVDNGGTKLSSRFINMISLRDLIYQEAEYEAECFLNKCSKESSSVNNDDNDDDDDESVDTTAAVDDGNTIHEEEDDFLLSDLLLCPNGAAIIADAEMIEQRHNFLSNHQPQYHRHIDDGDNDNYYEHRQVRLLPQQVISPPTHTVGRYHQEQQEQHYKRKKKHLYNNDSNDDDASINGDDDA
ncbi:hypothetical protein FRACYDRAFT_246071 [Fragilariopsis cylindrus CCMP1102]|uniref:Uncharacterized protein n=1 Tax=Fragilariopsis cylindrus CCMP1102 TaxID=635003 RepID=A0A1E7EY75_9STRA|nr:hypothetical protein FRACYDRAFT_246071 [Fragilariopsis cylindrus CCMP1102]|eukprot:OEU10970.1 hypothetical protein FRACYDRAFT_246071 [Fragilariopsis cylindrus CCMP1102]